MSEDVARLHQPAAEVSEEALKRAEEMIEREEGVQNKLRGWLAGFVTTVAVVMSVWHLYTAYVIVRTEHLRATHVGFVLFLVFLVFPVSRRWRHRVMWWDWMLAAAAIATAGYVFWDTDDFINRSVIQNDWDVYVGGALILMILEAMRRTTGWILPFVTSCFLAYALFGSHLPPPWTVGMDYDLKLLVGHMYMTQEGIYGTAIAVSSTLIILFTIYGAFLQFSGAGKFFIDFSFAAMGGRPTGAGRTVTLASFLLGGPSGSGVATTVTLGSVAAPMLLKVGYSKEEAGGLLAAGGLGAIISPPVLGAAAFLIAEFLKISYFDVLLMATIPTCLYYLALFVMVELDVRKFGMKDVLFEQVESAWSLSKKYWFHFLSLVAIIVFMLPPFNFSPKLAVFWATVVAFFTSLLRSDTSLLAFEKNRSPWRNVAGSGLVKALEGGSLAVLNVAATCAGAGLIVGAVTLTGLGQKFSTIVLAYAGNSLLLTAIFTSLVIWVVGLAVPVTASYIICATIAAPALIALEVPPFAAHMFIFYYAVLSEVSPPTALSPFAAAAITGGDPYKTTMQCWKYTVPAFLVPFMFVLDPSGTGLLLTGSIKTLGQANWGSIALVTFTAAVGIVALAGGFQGWLFRRTPWHERLMLIVAGVLLVYPSSATDLVGFGLVAVVVVLQWLRKEPAAPSPQR